MFDGEFCKRLLAQTESLSSHLIHYEEVQLKFFRLDQRSKLQLRTIHHDHEQISSASENNFPRDRVGLNHLKQLICVKLEDSDVVLLSMLVDDVIARLDLQLEDEDGPSRRQRVVMHRGKGFEPPFPCLYIRLKPLVNMTTLTTLAPNGP